MFLKPKNHVPCGEYYYYRIDRQRLSRCYATQGSVEVVAAAVFRRLEQSGFDHKDISGQLVLRRKTPASRVEMEALCLQPAIGIEVGAGGTDHAEHN